MHRTHKTARRRRAAVGSFPGPDRARACLAPRTRRWAPRRPPARTPSAGDRTRSPWAPSRRHARHRGTLAPRRQAAQTGRFTPAWSCPRPRRVKSSFRWTTPRTCQRRLATSTSPRRTTSTCPWRRSGCPRCLAGTSTNTRRTPTSMRRRSGPRPRVRRRFRRRQTHHLHARRRMSTATTRTATSERRPSRPWRALATTTSRSARAEGARVRTAKVKRATRAATLSAGAC